MNTKESTIKSLILDTIFPRRCLGCEQILDSDSSHSPQSLLCNECPKSIDIKKEYTCAFCNSLSVDGKTCQFCIRSKNLDQLYSVTSYSDLPENIVKTMKYKFIPSLSVDIGIIMANFMLDLGEKINPHSVIIPIPLHRLRYNWRGFNQSDVIAKEIAERSGMTYFPDTLKRNKHVTPQAEISDKESRINNVKKQFDYNLSSDLKNDIVILVDDVATTGSTLEEAASVLKQHGASRVIGFVFAKD